MIRKSYRSTSVCAKISINLVLDTIESFSIICEGMCKYLCSYFGSIKNSDSRQSLAGAEAIAKSELCATEVIFIASMYSSVCITFRKGLSAYDMRLNHMVVITG